MEVAQVVLWFYYLISLVVWQHIKTETKITILNGDVHLLMKLGVEYLNSKGCGWNTWHQSFSRENNFIMIYSTYLCHWVIHSKLRCDLDFEKYWNLLQERNQQLPIRNMVSEDEFYYLREKKKKGTVTRIN